ncbi:hypothetical protein MMC22_008669 [Lobaria immixta]|nr:hypothetical protein [Lobaria immixta]
MAFREQVKQATFFIRVSTNPIIREEFCVSDNGVLFVEAKQSEMSNERLTGRLVAILNVVRFSSRISKQAHSRPNPQVEEAPSSLSNSDHSSTDQDTGDVTDLVEFLQSQKSEAQWMQDILSRQIWNLQPIVLETKTRRRIDPVYRRNENTTGRNFTEIKNRVTLLQQAIDLLSETDDTPSFRLVADVIKFLRSQAADMTFGAEEEQRKIENLARTDQRVKFLDRDPCTKALLQKAKWESRAEEYHWIAERISKILKSDRAVELKKSPLTYWRRR